MTATDGGTVAVSAGGSATITNTRNTGSLKVTKLVTGDIPADLIPANFTITVTDVDGNEQTKTVQNGTTVEFTGLATGAATIKEEADDAQVKYYTLSVDYNDAQVEIVKDSTSEATVTNTYTRDKGNLTVKKVVDGVETDKKYTITVSGPSDFTPQTIELGNGEKWEFTDIPSGTYTITESETGVQIATYDWTNPGALTGEVTKNGNAEVVVTNKYTRQLSSATITKTVVSPSDADKSREYEFTAILMDGSTKVWTKTFTLSDGESQTYTGLPVGAVLTVTEKDYTDDHITTTVTNNGTVTIENGKTKTIAFTNTRELADIIVMKDVNGSVVDGDKEFTFTWSVAGTEMSGTAKLTDDGEFKIEGVPVGAALTVTETGDETYTTTYAVDGGNSVSGTSAVQTVASGGHTILFTNNLKNSTVTVEKSIENEVNRDKTFDFTATLYFKDAPIAFPASAQGNGITFSDDRMSADFALGDGDSVTFAGLPIGTELRVVEDGSEDYTTVNTDGEGVNAAQVVTLAESDIIFTNTRKAGTVKVSKAVVGSTNDGNVPFTFTAQLWDGEDQVAFPASVGQIEGIELKDNNKTITFTLKHGEELKISGLYAGTTLKVVEAVPANYTAKPESDEAKVEGDTVKDIDITNLRKLADVDVKKIVAGHVIHDDIDFAFTATLWDGETPIAFPGETEIGAKTFTLKHDESKTFADLFVGSTLKIEETENPLFTTGNTHGEGFNAAYTVKEMNNETVVYTNTIKTGSAKVTKTVVGDIIDKAEDFEFTAELYFRGEKITFPDGDEVKTFELNHEGEKLFEDLPIGTVLKVVETANGNYITTYTGADEETTPAVAIVGDAVKTLAYTNTLKETEMTITKNVTGNMGDYEKAFSFVVTMKDKYDNGLKFKHNGAEVTAANFTLKHGESVTLTEIPAGAIVTIEEESGVYTASAVLNGDEQTTVKMKHGSAEFTVEDATADEVVVINDYTVTVDTGISLDSMPYIITLVMAGGLFLLLRKRKAQEA